MEAIDFSKYDLTAQRERDAAIREVSIDAGIELLLKLGIHEKSIIQVRDWCIYVKIRDSSKKGEHTIFGSDIDISAETRLTKVPPVEWEQIGVTISAGGNGGFDPNKEPDMAAKFHNMTALISNWTKTVEIFNFYTSEYRRLRKLIEQQNNVK